MTVVDRRQSILQKVAVRGDLFANPEKPYLGDPLKAGKDIIGKTTSRVLGDVISQQLTERLRPKPSVAKMIFGRGGALQKALAFGAVAAGIGGGVALGDKVLSTTLARASKKRGFRDLMRENPDLTKEPAKDVKMIYSTLHRFAPRLARDPLVAGSFLKRSLQFRTEGIQPNDIKTLAEIGRNMAQAKKESILSKAFGAVAGAPGMDI